MGSGRPDDDLFLLIRVDLEKRREMLRRKMEEDLTEETAAWKKTEIVDLREQERERGNGRFWSCRKSLSLRG